VDEGKDTVLILWKPLRAKASFLEGGRKNRGKEKIKKTISEEKNGKDALFHFEWRGKRKKQLSEHPLKGLRMR